MRLVSRALRLLGLVGAFLLVGEATSRLDDYLRFGTPLGATPDHARDLTVHDSLGIRGRPHGHFKHWQLNAFGFRGPDSMSVEPRPGVKRVLVLGASETLGLYERPGHEYAAQLRDSLSADGFEVVNAGVAGATLRTLIVLWNNWGSRFRPEVVVVYPTTSFYLSDVPPSWPRRPTEPPVGAAAAPAGERPSSRLVERLKDNVELPEAVNRWRHARAVRARLQEVPADSFFTGVPAERLAMLVADTDSLLTAIEARRAVPLLVIPASRFAPPLDRRDHDLLLAQRRFVPRADERVLLDFHAAAVDSLRALGARRRVAVVDAAAELTGRRDYFADGVHFTDAGAAALSARLSRALRGLPPSRSSTLTAQSTRRTARAHAAPSAH